MANVAGKRSNYNLSDLPSDLQIKIVSLIASASITDLFNLTQTCKSLREAGTHPIVLQNAPVWSQFHAFHNRRLKNKESAIADAGGVARFVTQCVNSGNQEAMLCRQMAEYILIDEELRNLIGEKKKEEAVRCLKMADAKGHVAAKVACGVIYLMAGGGEEDEEFEVVRGMIGRPEEIGECRRAGKFLIDCINARKVENEIFSRFSNCIRRVYSVQFIPKNSGRKKSHSTMEVIER